MARRGGFEMLVLAMARETARQQQSVILANRRRQIREAGRQVREAEREERRRLHCCSNICQDDDSDLIGMMD